MESRNKMALLCLRMPCRPISRNHLFAETYTNISNVPLSGPSYVFTLCEKTSLYGLGGRGCGDQLALAKWEKDECGKEHSKVPFLGRRTYTSWGYGNFWKVLHDSYNFGESLAVIFGKSLRGYNSACEELSGGRRSGDVTWLGMSISGTLSREKSIWGLRHLWSVLCQE